MRLVLALGIFLVWAGSGQVQPAAPSQPTPPAPRPENTPQEGKAAPEKSAPEKPALVNAGRPMKLEASCTLEDIQSAGLDCTDEASCRLFLELSAMETVGNKIFLIGNIHTPSTTLYSVFLASEDSGKTWREAYERLRGTGLDHIQFIDFENGWISGQELYPLPRDPFLLITNDGGKTWRQRPLFSEPRMGSIQQFWFSSRQNGTLVVDRGASGDAGRYELYESPNGGETWMVREVSDRPVRIRRGPETERGWRIRPEASSHSFRIERQQGERWVQAAAFLVPIGICKPPDAVSPAPPPESEPSAAPEPPPQPAPRKPPSLRRPKQ